MQTRDFQLDTLFDATAKAAVTELEDGDLLIEGYASGIGLDRAGDVMLPGAFDRSIQKFLETNPILLENHDITKALGRVLALEPRDQGLWMKARIDKPTPGSWAEDTVRKIMRGTIKGLSVRGRMRRPDGSLALPGSGGGPVTDVDLYEISVTPLPVSPSSLFSVTQKAFESDEIDDATRKAINDYMELEFAHVEAMFEDLRRRMEAA